MSSETQASSTATTRRSIVPMENTSPTTVMAAANPARKKYEPPMLRSQSGQQNGQQRARRASPSEGVSKSPRDGTEASNRMLFLVANLIGQVVRVTLRNNVVYEGVLTSANADNGFHVALKLARKVIVGQDRSRPSEPVTPRLAILPSEFVRLEAVDVNLTSIGIKSSGFRVDSDIGKGSQTAERPLERWEPSVDPQNPSSRISGSLKDADNRWDQFEVNERRFGLKNTYQEEFYTTRLDRDAPDFEEKMKQAAKLAAEISAAPSLGYHHAEERGIDVSHDVPDEETRFSAVARESIQSSRDVRVPQSRLLHGSPRPESSMELTSKNAVVTGNDAIVPAASSFQTPVPDEPRTPVVSTPTPSQETTIESKSKIGPKFNPKASVFLPSFVAPHPVAIAAPLPMAVHMTPVHAPLPPQVVQSSTEFLAPEKRSKLESFSVRNHYRDVFAGRPRQQFSSIPPVWAGTQSSYRMQPQPPSDDLINNAYAVDYVGQGSLPNPALFPYGQSPDGRGPMYFVDPSSVGMFPQMAGFYPGFHPGQQAFMAAGGVPHHQSPLQGSSAMTDGFQHMPPMMMPFPASQMGIPMGGMYRSPSGQAAMGDGRFFSGSPVILPGQQHPPENFNQKNM